MIVIEIPGRQTPLVIRTVVLDYNGTVARDGKLLPDILERIRKLQESADVYILTADTYGTVESQCMGLGIPLKTFPQEGAGICKEQIVRQIGGGVCAIGNGRNDIPMFTAADLSIAVMGQEGVCAALLSDADVLVSSPVDALDLLLIPNRLRATLRN